MVDIQAYSGLAADIQAALNSASAGDRVILPPGRFNWNGETVTRPEGGVDIIGASPAGCLGHENNWTPLTASTILHNVRAEAMFYLGRQTHGSLINRKNRISGIQFEADPAPTPAQEDVGNAITLHQIPNYRVDHCTFLNFSNIAVFADAGDGYVPSGTVNCYGVIDHCSIDNPYKRTVNNIPSALWMWAYGFYTRGAIQDVSGWEPDITKFAGKYEPTTYGASIMFVEDCRIDWCRHGTDGINGGWGVIRHNLFEHNIPNYGQINSHGGSGNPSGYMSARGFEVYNNKIVETTLDNDFAGGSYGAAELAVNLRNGSGLVHDNVFEVTQPNPYTQFMGLADEGKDAQGNPSITRCRQVYIWNNTYPTTHIYNQSAYVENQDYFLRAPNLSQDGFTYTPYPYPHPLVTGEPPPPQDVTPQTRTLNAGNYRVGIPSSIVIGGKKYRIDHWEQM